MIIDLPTKKPDKDKEKDKANEDEDKLVMAKSEIDMSEMTKEDKV